MFFTIIIIASIAAPLMLILNKKGKDNTFFRIVGGVCLAFSWVLIVMWFTVLIEGWQLTLNTPMADNNLVPMWGRVVQNLLRNIAFLLPVSRLTLGILYASPIILVPIWLMVVKRLQATSIMMYSALVNLLFFWILFIVDNWLRISHIRIPIQGVVLLTIYALSLYVLIRQRPFSPNSNDPAEFNPLR